MNTELQPPVSRIVCCLRSLLSPFVLRRMQSVVLGDILPPKRSILLHVDKSTVQGVIYAALRASDDGEAAHFMVSCHIPLADYYWGGRFKLSSHNRNCEKQLITISFYAGDMERLPCSSLTGISYNFIRQKISSVWAMLILRLKFQPRPMN